MGVDSLISSYTCGRPVPILNSMKVRCWFHITFVGIPCQLEVPRRYCNTTLLLWTCQVNLRFHRGGNLIPMGPQSMEVGILVASYPCGIPNQFEVPWGCGFWYVFSRGHSKWIWSIMGVEICISFYPCQRAKSIWTSIRGWNLDTTVPLWTPRVKLKFQEVGNSDIVLRLQTFHVNVRLHVGGNRDIFLPLWTCQVSLKFHWLANRDITLPLETFHVKFMSNLNSMGIGIWTSSNRYQHAIWTSSNRYQHAKSAWSSMGVGILMSVWTCAGVRILYHLTPVDIRCQYESPGRWESW
jgi:hypothetical protein